MIILPEQFNALVTGKGGREMMFVVKLNESPRVIKTFVTPGTDGFREYAEVLGIEADDFNGIKKTVLDNEIKLIVVGSEDPLVKGIVDFIEDDIHLQKAGVRILGFGKAAAMLEGSKIISGMFCKRHKIPAPDFIIFSSPEKVEQHMIYGSKYPAVIKLDGLAAGKGVRVCNNPKETHDFLEEIASGKFGKAARHILLQDYVSGTEVSIIALVSRNGNRCILPVVQDYKPVEEGSVFMTGGMGGFAPNKFLSEKTKRLAIEWIIDRAIAGMIEDGISSSGFFYAGIKITPEGDPVLLEINVRGGDPETETHLPLLCSDFVSLIEATLKGEMDSEKIIWSDKASVCLMLTSKGYGLPGGYETGFPVSGLDEAKNTGVLVLPFGVKSDGKGGYVTDAGRCIALVAVEDTFAEARKKVYAAREKIICENLTCRPDIGDEAVE